MGLDDEILRALDLRLCSATRNIGRSGVTASDMLVGVIGLDWRPREIEGPCAMD